MNRPADRAYEAHQHAITRAVEVEGTDRLQELSGTIASIKRNHQLSAKVISDATEELGRTPTAEELEHHYTAFAHLLVEESNARRLAIQTGVGRTIDE